MTMRRMTKSQHKDIFEYLLYLQDIMYLNDWRFELSEMIEEHESRIASVWTSPLKKEASFAMTEWFFKDRLLDFEWKSDHRLYLCHECSHLLLKDQQWISEVDQYRNFIPPYLVDFHDANVDRAVERTVESIARIVARFAKPFEWTPEVIDSESLSTAVEAPVLPD